MLFSSCNFNSSLWHSLTKLDEILKYFMIYWSNLSKIYISMFSLKIDPKIRTYECHKKIPARSGCVRVSFNQSIWLYPFSNGTLDRLIGCLAAVIGSSVSPLVFSVFMLSGKPSWELVLPLLPSKSSVLAEIPFKESPAYIKKNKKGTRYSKPLRILRCDIISPKNTPNWRYQSWFYDFVSIDRVKEKDNLFPCGLKAHQRKREIVRISHENSAQIEDATEMTSAIKITRTNN